MYDKFIKYYFRGLYVCMVITLDDVNKMCLTKNR